LSVYGIYNPPVTIETRLEFQITPAIRKVGQCGLATVLMCNARGLKPYSLQTLWCTA